MLTQETKRKIDSARQILVGKVPDPKAQVEQITTALIYKFMDDMDKEAIELGGKARFFTNGFQKYAWTKLLDPKLGGHERLELYGEAVARMSQNPHIPQLFRDIFKDAFLPYRSPETLTLFLKEINGFTYNHSEELGNAFEYLLSILGSQGDAGQFRTPRHIIDFIVDVIEPKKGDTILDPACGTAGFLISAYKNILKQQKDKPLTPDEKKKLMNNLVGYDISPDMVKLSKVNMYLHGFAEPKIFEYDTLSSDEKWDESFDVIMANPPFMSPQGGIRPHKRFSVQANRAEVLFVDYIKEHLRPNGRAGIIVPEGIIFQSSGAYKQLRKILVEDGLFAVVSLPQGVFNPYAGVKTSILFFDNTVAKKTDKILFVRVLNDGFDLGAQRRPIDRNDLVRPDNEVDATKVLKGQRIAIETGMKNPWLQENSLFAYEISKEQIAQSGDYNLSAERYRLDNLGEQKNQKWPVRKIGELIETITPPTKIQKSEFGNNGKYPIIDQSQEEISGWTDDESALVNANNPLVIFGDHTCAVKYLEQPFAQGADGIKIIKTNDELLPKYLYFYLKLKPIESDGYKRHFSKLKDTKIPLPPIEVQKEIVERIEVKQNAIEHAKAIIENLERERRYFGQSLRKLGDIPMAKIGDICEVGDGNHSSNYPKSSEMVNQGVPFIRATNIQNLKIDSTDMKFISEEKHNKLKKGHLKTNDVIFSNRGEIGKVAIIDKEYDSANLNSQLAWLRSKEQILPRFLLHILNSEDIQGKIKTEQGGATLQQYTIKQIKDLKIPLPPLEVQEQMVEEMEKEEEIIASNRNLIEAMEKKISGVLNDYA
ncbi:MAG: N-6 DNA methylase [Candidatus Pacebacteria bacterium]|nr:N-6 DNA methylase [Candidatus Paceibacterota bacterium]